MVDLDEMDRRILSLLQKDASLSTAEISQAVGLSASPCWRRVRRLKETGVVRAAVTLLDPEKVGLSVMVMASVNLTRHSEANVAAFEEAVRNAPEVMDCFAVTGDRDYMLRIVVSSIEAYDRFLSTKLLSLEAVQSVNSRFSLRSVKSSTVLPI